MKQMGISTDSQRLLQTWCDALLSLQVNEPDNPQRHGSYRCPACGDEVHGRCGDSAYPLMTLSRITGDMRYKDAALRTIEWMANVDRPDGSWTNDLDPESWKGITVFTAISLAHLLKHNDCLIDVTLRNRLLRRLRQAGGFVRKEFTLSYGNVNYGICGSYCLALLGHMLGETEWLERARELAHEALQYLTAPNGLIYGEGRPENRVSPQGCRPVDLGYNVEESLPALLLYAQLTGDEEVREAAISSMKSHLAFMLPDGSWDNSWGTRNYKWTWWGSRTTDGCLAALVSEAEREPVFATAALRHLALLRASTRDGLLMGGPHLDVNRTASCVHHTFCHAKALAELLDAPYAERLDHQMTQPSGAIGSRIESAVYPLLPRETADGVNHYPEIGVWLAARDGWRATVTSGDWFYAPQVRHASGGMVSLLWHDAVGPVLASSLTDYVQQEPHNMQPVPDNGWNALTMRVECEIGHPLTTRYSTLYHAAAKVTCDDVSGDIHFDVRTALQAKEPVADSEPCSLSYLMNERGFQLTVHPMAINSQADSIQESAGSSRGRMDTNIQLVLPVIACADEQVARISETCLLIRKSGGNIRVESNQPIRSREADFTRWFNLVPGLQAVPLMMDVPCVPNQDLIVRISVEPASVQTQGNTRSTISFAPIFGDHMVLQRDKAVPVWGTGPEGAIVAISCRGKLLTAPVTNGVWRTELEPMETGPSFSLEAGLLDAQGGFVAHHRLEDVLAGDVYLAGGQSNMEFRLSESIGAREWAEKADMPLLRSWYCPRVPYVGAQADDPDADFCKPPVWNVCTPDTAPGFSAVAFHFARMLQEETGVPIGLLDANWGGSSATCWMDESDLEGNTALEPWISDHRRLLETLDPEAYEANRARYAEEVAAYVTRETAANTRGLTGPERETFIGTYPWPPPSGPKNALSPCGLYHTMLEPMAPYAMKGVICYQGETDAGIPGSPMGADKYSLLFGTMIARWRTLFHQPELPFLFVQLTSYGCDGDPDGENWPVLREQQKKVAETIPGCAMAVITDYGDLLDIHPKHKQPVGERLARLAMKRLYGLPIADSGPVFRDASMDGQTVLLRFDACEGGLVAGSKDPLAMAGMFAGNDAIPVLNGFTLAGEDGEYHPAEALISGDVVRVQSDAVKQPCTVQYGWSNHTIANLYNSEGLPATPFRIQLA